ncbi:hypothetical protein PISL3812_06177 [Talaromyces islandicus]|uniref:Uncharacterized protein n=1 Tax=Talaromyces islandicus TaxID=28573 RepID=A0A0U1M2E5_TALIS|nr:hypothetical protein PISL3812_06177 [Talaromyces islandicus]
MSACNPKPMTIDGITGLDSDEYPSHAVDGKVLVMVDKNFFYEDDLDMFINVSVNAVMSSVQKNYVNMTIENDLLVNYDSYNVTWSSANSTELNYYEFGFTEYTQAFSVDYEWVGGKGHTNEGEVCSYAGQIVDMLVSEVPGLAELGQFTTEVCGAVFDVGDDS